MPKPYELSEAQADALASGCSESGGALCGLDEAGRGALAGPLVAAAVVLRSPAPAGIADSKALTRKQRERLFDAILASAWVGVGVVDAATIDSIRIQQANFLAMQLALKQLVRDGATPAAIIVDGNYLTAELQRDANALRATIGTLVSADAKVAAVSAASIVAKVTRDRLMVELDAAHPGYGFATSAGYGSPAHLAAIRTRGASPVHRMSFSPMSTMVGATAE